nr:glutaredoxin 3 [uncultured Lichenicoccus sp.]
MAQIEIYTQPYCPFCARALALLQGKGVTFQEINAPHGTAERQVSAERSGGRTSVPQIFVDGRHIGGCDDLMALDGRGELDPMLKAA